MRITSRAVLAALALVMIAVPRPAFAQDKDKDKDCPPGSWFCGDTQPPPANGGSSATGTSTTGADRQTLPAAEPRSAGARPAAPPPPVVVYQPAPVVVQQAPREAPPAYIYVPRSAPSRKEWGLNLHLGGVMMGRGRDEDAGMALAGLGLRFRPVPGAALQVDLDFAGGRDYNGFRRNETALSFNGLFFVNPRNATQVYFLAGFGFSGATAVDDRGYDSVTYKYGYFGVQGGVGLEFRLSRTIALNVDLRGMLRGRVDDRRRDYYEFVDGNGRGTNSSGAGLLTGGLTFYW